MVSRPPSNHHFSGIDPRGDAVFTHLTSEKSAQAIRRAGIKAVSAGHGTPMGVFCMPLLADDFARTSGSGS